MRKAGAHLLSNQKTFMKMMGITDPGPVGETDSEDWESPIKDSEIEILVTATKHEFFEAVRREGVNDGHLYEENAKKAVRIPAEQVAQCNCAVHRKLLEDILSNEEMEEMKAIIRGAANLRSSADAG